MSQENVANLREGIEEFNRRDLDAALARCRGDVTWDSFLSRTETSEPLRGRGQVRASWVQQIEAVDLRVEADEFIPVGDAKVVVPVRFVAHGTSSGISLTDSTIWIYTFDDDGLIARVELFDSRAEALEAAGLSE